MKTILLIVLISISHFSFCQTKFTHTSTLENVSSNSTYINNAGLNNNPNAIIIVEVDANTRAANPYPLGVWYDGTKWAIFNQSKTAIPVGLNFNLIWKNPDNSAFWQKASAANIVNGKMALDNPSLNNNPTANFYASQVWNPNGNGGVYNNADITLQYDKVLGKWLVLNTNAVAIESGSAFNILLINANTINATAKIENIGDVKVNPSALEGAFKTGNFGFEKGLTNWNATGTAFANQPISGNTVLTDRVLKNMQYNSNGLGGDYWKGLPYNIGNKGNNWIGSFENGNGDLQKGTLTSIPFNASARYIHFLLGGGSDINNLYVELQVKQEDFQAAWGVDKKSLFGNTPDGYIRVSRISPLINTEDLYRYYFDLENELKGQYLNKSIRLSIVDNKATAWGHINVDDFQQVGEIPEFIAINKSGFTLYADLDKPVWGYFDSHAHPGADEAFGKNLYVGSSNTALSTTWSNDVCSKSHTWGATLNGFINTIDPHKFFDGGWPDMLGYPKFNGKTHQKYQVDLIKRAWQGGLKIFCALGINSMYIATRALGLNGNGEALDDESVLLRQVAVMKTMASQNSDWMEIALTPNDARRIVLEGKLCVILGLESDIFGNFKSPDCSWSNRSDDKPLVNITPGDADVKLEAKLTEYYNLGLRQILPLHYLNKPFGGTAVFNGNTILPQIEFYQSVNVKSGIPHKVGYNLYEDFQMGASFVGSGISYSDFAGRIHKQDAGAEISMVNADGLTEVGNTLFTKLMKKGFIIDQEHASYQSKQGIFQIAKANNNYPIISSHTAPVGLSFTWTGAPVRFNGFGEDKIRNFNTSTIRYVAHEMELNDESYEGIKNSNGICGVFTLSNHKQKYSGSWGNIPNDCAGSTKTFAQLYCYSLDKMNGKGVGLASDLPMVDAVGPRFGPYAAFALTVEDDDLLKKVKRSTDRFLQTNGVKYDIPSRSYFHGLFANGGIDGFEEEVWKALAAWEAGVDAVADESLVTISGTVGHQGRIRNMVKGLNYNTENELMRYCITCGAAPWEQAAMFCLKNNIQPLSLTIHDAAGLAEVTSMYNRILPIYNLWKAKNGNNEPLRRSITGKRYWDFNLDGLAHYGLMPDLLQDLKNIGFTEKQLKPLFNSADDYIKMWEKTLEVKKTL